MKKHLTELSDAEFVREFNLVEVWQVLRGAMGTLDRYPGRKLFAAFALGALFMVHRLSK
ncbi:MAG: hypothetical protein ACE5FB_08180 [Candidatus Binatia bacterium]